METGVKVPYIIVGTVNDMTTRKIFLIAIGLSLAAHIAALSLTGFLGSEGPADGEDVFTVSFERRPGTTAEMHGIENTSAAGLPGDIRERAREGSVETVNLDSTDTRYFPYLFQVKESIDRQWSYPHGAFARGEVGTTIVEFSIASGGALTGCRAIVSSGYESLDAESLRAVRSAAPFSPFSKEFGLARLNIVAKFRYTLAE